MAGSKGHNIDTLVNTINTLVNTIDTSFNNIDNKLNLYLGVALRYSSRETHLLWYQCIYPIPVQRRRISYLSINLDPR